MASQGGAAESNGPAQQVGARTPGGDAANATDDAKRAAPMGDVDGDEKRALRGCCRWLLRGAPSWHPKHLTRVPCASCTVEAPAPAVTRVADEEADCVIVGAGPVGLYTAVQLRLRCPAMRVVMLEKYETYQRQHVLRIEAASLVTGLEEDHPSLAAALQELVGKVRRVCGCAAGGARAGWRAHEPRA